MKKNPIKKERSDKKGDAKITVTLKPKDSLILEAYETVVFTIMVEKNRQPKTEEKMTSKKKRKASATMTVRGAK